MKRIVNLVVMILCIGMLLCACQAKNEPVAGKATTAATAAETVKATVAATTAAKKNVKFGVCMQGNSDWSQVMKTQAEALCKERGWEIVVVNAESDAQKQINAVQSLISHRVDVMWIHVVDAVAIAPVVKEAVNAGIYVNISSSVRPYVGDMDKLFYYTYDHEHAAALCAEALAKKIGGEGKVCMISGTAGASNTTLRSKGFHEYMEKNYPKITIINDIDVNWDRAKAMSTAEDVMTANPDLKGFFCMGEDILWGTCEAIKNKGMKIATVSIDCSSKIVKMIMDGEVTAAVSCRPSDGPYCTIRLYECSVGLDSWSNLDVRKLSDKIYGNELNCMTIENADYSKADYIVKGFGG